ncbi:MAG: hypothetical protein AB1567_07790 [bacterium]
MTKHEFYNRVTNSKKDIIHEFLQILQREEIPYSVIGGVAVNTYCEPILTLDFDCVVVIEQLERLKDELKRRKFKVKSHPHTWEVTHKVSDVRIQIQRDERYQEFISRAKLHKVLGYTMKVAQIEDVLTGKIWAYQDTERDELKRDKDLLDIKRLVQRYPKLDKFLNDKIKEKLRK